MRKCKEEQYTQQITLAELSLDTPSNALFSPRQETFVANITTAERSMSSFLSFSQKETISQESMLSLISCGCVFILPSPFSMPIFVILFRVILE